MGIDHEEDMRRRRDLKNPMHLYAYLRSFDVPTTTWGRGSAKTFDHLHREIMAGEAFLVEDGKILVREIRLVKVAVFYNTRDGKVLQLCEEKQVFKNGRVRIRGFKYIGEKMKPGEHSGLAALRAIAEELGVVEGITLLDHKTSSPSPEFSKSYPGLMTRIVEESFTVFMPHNLYKPEGYKEEQEDKTTYFVWQEVETPPQ